MTRAYVPERGDVVWLKFSPQGGHKQAGRRPALVLSPASYNSKTGLMLCCPVTNQVKGYPSEVDVAPSTGKATGVALADQVRCLDWRARKASRFASVCSETVMRVSAKIKRLLP